MERKHGEFPSMNGHELRMGEHQLDAPTRRRPHEPVEP